MACGDTTRFLRKEKPNREGLKGRCHESWPRLVGVLIEPLCAGSIAHNRLILSDKYQISNAQLRKAISVFTGCNIWLRE